jgi:hypothetical protein
METVQARQASSMDELHQVGAVDPSIADRFSLVIGGPFYRALMRMRLAEPLPNLELRIIVFILLTWVPLFALTLAEGTAIGSKVDIALLRDFSVYGRFLVGLPLLILAEEFIDPWIQRVVATFNTSGLVRNEDLPAYHAALAKTKRLRDSGLAELIVAVLASFPVFLLLKSQWTSQGITTWHGSMSEGVSPAGWWFTFVSSPIIRFIFLRWLWRYVLWTALLRKIGKLNLNMMPTHPDHLGGLGFVLFAQKYFGILFMAIGFLIAGQYGNSIRYFGMPVGATGTPMVVYVLLSVLLVLGPLTMLSPRLAETRRNGLDRYDQVARRLTGAFDAKWARGDDPAPESMLGNPDPSSLIDYVSSYQVIQDMQVIPISKQLVIQVAAMAAAPLVLVWILSTPLDTIFTGLLKMVL